MTAMGPYLLLHRLGAGGMGEVWTARRSALGGAAKLVAVKTLLPSKAGDPKARSMFLDEARLSMLLTNSNIVQVFDVSETRDGTCYMAMEFVDGIDLSKLIARLAAENERLAHVLVAHIVGEILKGLAHAHEFSHEGTRKSIVHRDVSPNNVMLSRSGEVKLMDFGVARLASEETSGTFVKGKIRYMPPEQIRGNSRHPSVDLFAAGAVLYELLEGTRFRGNAADETELLAMCVDGYVPPLTRRDIPDVLERLFRELTAVPERERIPSARAAHRLLSQWTGCRDARFELEELVQCCIDGTPLRRDGSNALTALKPRRATVPTQDVGEATVHDGPGTIDESPEPERDNELESATVTEPRSPRSLQRSLATVAVATFAVLIMAGTTTALDWWNQDTPVVIHEVAPEQHGERLPAEEPPQPDTSHLEAPPPSTEDTPRQDPPRAPEPTPPDPAPPDPARTSEQPTPEPRAAPASKPPPRTSVTISTPKVWTEVMIAEKSYIIGQAVDSKSVVIKVKPGEHNVIFHDAPDAGWLSAGKVTIPASGPVSLIINDNGRASIMTD